MFNGSFLRVCRILRFVPKHRNHWQEVEGLLFSPQNTTGTVFIQGPSIILPVQRSIMFNGSFLRGLVIQPAKHNRNRLYSRAIHCPASTTGTIFLATAQKPMARSRGFVIWPPKLSVGAYFELSFLGCGFLIHLSNRSDSPRFRAPWKIHQKYDIQQEPSLFKGHWFLCFGTRPRHRVFFTNRNILHTLKKEPLNIMLLHTGRTMDGP